MWLKLSSRNEFTHYPKPTPLELSYVRKEFDDLWVVWEFSDDFLNIAYEARKLIDAEEFTWWETSPLLIILTTFHDEILDLVGMEKRIYAANTIYAMIRSIDDVTNPLTTSWIDILVDKKISKELWEILLVE